MITTEIREHHKNEAMKQRKKQNITFSKKYRDLSNFLKKTGKRRILKNKG